MINTNQLEEKIWWRLLKTIYLGIYIIVILVVGIYLWFSIPTWNKERIEDKNLDQMYNNPKISEYISQQEQLGVGSWEIQSSLERTNNVTLPFDLIYSYPPDTGSGIQTAIEVSGGFLLFVEFLRFILLYILGVKGAHGILYYIGKILSSKNEY